MSRYTRIAQYWVRTAGLPERVQALMLKYPQVPPEQIREMVAVDPTGEKGQYLEWIVRKTKDDNIRWPEDRNRVQRALTGYVQIKKSSRQMKEQQVSPDINKYTLHDLEAVNRRIFGEKDSGSTPVSDDGSHLVYDDGEVQIRRIGGPGVDLDQAVQTACQMSEGSEWCTSDPKVAKSYLKRDPLYIIFKEGKKFAQFHGKSQQLMDIYDMDVNLEENPDVAAALWNSSIAELGTLLENTLALAHEGYYVRGRGVDPKKITRNPLREAEILKSHLSSIPRYCLVVLNGERWPEGELSLLSQEDPLHAYLSLFYATTILKMRWPEAEVLTLNVLADLQEPPRRSWPWIVGAMLESITQYAKSMINGRWGEFERVILAKMHADEIGEDVYLRGYSRSFGFSWFRLLREVYPRG